MGLNPVVLIRLAIYLPVNKARGGGSRKVIICALWYSKLYEAKIP